MARTGPVCTRRACLAAAASVTAGCVARPPDTTTLGAGEDDLAGLTLAQAGNLLRRGEASPVDLVHACLARIERFNPLLNAFITVAPEQALVNAAELEAELHAGRTRGPLHGIPIALKDNMDTAGLRTTGASELFDDRVPAEDSAVAHRLRQAGAIVLGKLNLNEFAYGGSATVTHYGTMHNPWALDRVTGGSSGGSAAAVAADLCYGALGTDTAGSVRIPASHCGVVGLKPTQGRVSTRGIFMLSWTLDCVGPLSKSVEDAALLLAAIAGYDAREPGTSTHPVPDYTQALSMDVAGLRLGMPGARYFDGLDLEVQAALLLAIEQLANLTAGVRDMPLPHAPSGARIWGPEAYAYHREWITTSPQRYQKATRDALERYADADASDYVLAQREVALARREVLAVFDQVDLLITPVMREPSPLIASGGGSGVSANAADFNVFGLPAIAVPCGFTTVGLPIGLQIVGAPLAEASVLALAHRYELLTGWRRYKPPL